MSKKESKKNNGKNNQNKNNENQNNCPRIENNNCR